MDYEKEYKRLVADIRKAHLYAQTDSTRNVLEDILPQLRKTEDDKMRDAISSALTCDSAEKCLESQGIRLGDALQWLNRQQLNRINEEELRIINSLLNDKLSPAEHSLLNTLAARYYWMPKETMMEDLKKIRIIISETSGPLTETMNELICYLEKMK